MAYKKDKRNATAEQEEMEELVGKKLRDGNGELQLRLATKLEDLVAHCQGVQAKKACYINLLMRDGDGKRVEQLMERALGRDGKRQWVLPAPKPVLRELKEAYRTAKGR